MSNLGDSSGMDANPEGSGGAHRRRSRGDVRVLTCAAASGLLFALLLFLAPVQGEEHITSARASTTMAVEIAGDLPGFSADAASQYLATQMSQAGVTSWTFVPMAASTPPAADRIEWRVQQSPYAGGGVRQFIPIPSVQRLFGTHHNISLAARLFLGGQYQTQTLGEAVVQGGPRDKALANLVTKLTQDLLGEHGAYRSMNTPTSPLPSTQSQPPP